MAKNKHQHVVPRGDGWAVVGEGNERASKVTDTQREAIEHAKSVASNSNGDVIIHNREGKICERNSYGNDPASRKG